MDRETSLAIVRAAYAKQVLAAAQVENSRLEAAFSAVRREDFLGPGPWPILRMFRDYVDTPSDDPVYLYTDDLVGIMKDRQINNGQPSLHATLLNHAQPKEGDHVVHIGAGVGYYTAIMTHLVGASGRVTGIEYEPGFAARAKANFRSYPKVALLEGDGLTVSFDAANVIYVNAGVTRPPNLWLDGLLEGGRLILPMTSEDNFSHFDEDDLETVARDGAVFCIQRRGSEYFAKWISPVCIFPCVGSRDVDSEGALAAAFKRGGVHKVTRLYRNQAIPEDRCWLKGSDWCLAYN